MTITSFDIRPYPLDLSRSFAYATLSLDQLDYALVTVGNGQETGYGEVAAAWDVTGETAGSAISLKTHLEPLVIGKTLESLEDVISIMAVVGREVAVNFALKAGLEAALFDLLGKTNQKNLLEYFDWQNQPVRSQQVISLNDYASHLSGQKAFKNPKFIKVKAKNDISNLIPLLASLRQQYPNTKITIDANQGWVDSQTALSHINQLAPHQIEWIEQPLKAADIDSLRELNSQSPIPIMLDESVLDYHDAELLCNGQFGRLVNIKLAKCGGLLEALKIAQLCDQRQIGYIIGDMLHSQLGTVMNLYAGLMSKPIIQDVMDPRRLRSDPTSGIAYDSETNTFTPPAGSGLGITFKGPDLS